MREDELPKLEDLFPGLRDSGYQITSPPSIFYNCVSWAAGDTKRPWWPDRDLFWPSEFYEETVETFAATFALFGFRLRTDESLEPGVDKVAIYAIGTEPQHMARQLPSGSWTSKLGDRVDIEHTLAALEGEEYGKVVLILARKRTTPVLADG